MLAIAQKDLFSKLILNKQIAPDKIEIQREMVSEYPLNL